MNPIHFPIRAIRTAVCVAMLGLGIHSASAEGSISSRDIQELREIVEKQSKQIDVLSEQVARLNSMLTAKIDATARVPVATPAVAAPTAAVPAVAAPAEFSPDTARAEAPEGKRHVVVKGETLTSIAKHYNLPLPELQKANKGIDERKLQIGQTLIIPTPATAETPAEKKENP